MSSSLSAIYSAENSLMLNQVAMNITNDNISNEGTKGYCDQTVNTSELTSLGEGGETGTNVNAAGSGAVIDSISRNVDSYLDSYYRSQNSISSYYSEYSNSTSTIQDAVNGLSGSGLTTDLNSFYSAADTLSSDPTDSTTRTAFVQSAENVASDFNSISSQLSTYRASIVGDGTDAESLSQSAVTQNCNSLNTDLKSLASLNSTIASSSTGGVTPNNLLDQRDQLLDDMSQYAPLTVTQNSNNTANVSLGNVNLVNGGTQVGVLQTTLGDASDPATVQICDSNGNAIVSNANSLITSGKIGADLELGGSDPNSLSINSYINNLNTLATSFAQQVNTIQEGGQYTDNSTNPATLSTTNMNDIFVQSPATQTATYPLTAADITVNQNVINDPFQVAAASATSAANATGDGSNALLLYQSSKTSIAGLNNQTTQQYMDTLNGTIGTQIQNITNNASSSSTIVSQIATQKGTASGVNLDEELSNLIEYQNQYEASAKVLNAVEASLQALITAVS